MELKRTIYKNVKLLSFSWILVIFILCATPGQYIPSADWLELVSFDKLVHASLFFILASLLFLVVIKYQQSLLRKYLYLFLSIAYGVSLEVMQAKLFINRSADWKDMIANTFGCVMALLVFKKLQTIFQNA